MDLSLTDCHHSYINFVKSMGLTIFLVEAFKWACIGALIIGFIYFYKKVTRSEPTIINNYYSKKK